MYKVMLVDDNPLSIEGIRKNIDWASKQGHDISETFIQ